LAELRAIQHAGEFGYGKPTMPQRFYSESKAKPRGDWRYATFRTKLGWMAAVWHSQAVAGLSFVQDDAVAAARWANQFLTERDVHGDIAKEAEIPWRLAERMREFAKGEPTSFGEIPLDVTHLAPFGRKVAAECCALAWGETASYAEIAGRVGSPAAARAVGNCMRTNRLPLLIPCHRVVGAGGSLGGYSAPTGLSMKCRLLAAEGVGLPAMAGS